MDFSRPLLLKGLGGLAAVGTVGGVGIAYGEKIGSLLKVEEKGETKIFDPKVDCGGDDNADERCSEYKEELKKARKEVNDKLGSLGLEGDCLLDDSEDPSNAFPKECSLDEGKLKKIKFSNKGDGDLKVSGEVPENLKLKIDGTKEDFSFYFTGLTTGSDIKILGDKSKGKIILKSDRKFKDVNGQLIKDSSGADADLKTKLEEHNKQLETVNAPLECRFDEEENEESIDCPITEGELKGLEFSGLGEEELTIVGWPSSETVKLKVEKEEENSISLSFTGLTNGSNINVLGNKTKRKIIIRNDDGNNKKFKVEGGKLTKGTPDENLKTLNDQLEKVNVPLECRFDETESDTSVECDLSKEQLKTVVFKNGNGQGELTYSSDSSDFTGMKLKVQIIKTTDSDGSEKISDLFLTFKDYDKTVKLMKDQKEIVSLIKGTNPEFLIQDENNENIKNSVLIKLWNPDDFKNLLGLMCSFTEGDSKEECIFPESEEEINLGKGTGDELEKLKIEKTSGKIFELHKDVEDYNQGFKFIFKGEAVAGADGSPSLVEGKEYEFKWKHQDGTKVGYLVKKN